ncbi:hypothetical protein ACFWPA_07895 [Rhodococcus sp. NPDC058505]|uniref:hypothetical protein n=1 Tax=unclassified Rhodococcus (in: high G+C Gram-positive bacteria) TaxID=192944 RepID=UPI0036485F9F
MRHWLDHQIVATGRLPLLCFLLGFILGFVFIRISVRMIRAQVRWWPGNVTPGGQHVHHVVFGVVTMVVCGVALIATYEDGTRTSGALLAAGFGIGMALVLDEFALIFYLKDVYWSEQGRASVDAVFAAVAVTGLLLLGARPDSIVNPADFRDNPDLVVRLALVVSSLLSLAIAGVVIAKGKIWTALFGMFISPMLLVGAIRLSRPGAPWARWRYQDRPKRMARAVQREKRYRRPLIRAKIYVQDLIAGKPSLEHAVSATEAELERTVRPAPAPARVGAADGA